MSLVYKNLHTDCPIEGVASKRSLFENDGVQPKFSTINGFRSPYKNGKRIFKNKNLSEPLIEISSSRESLKSVGSTKFENEQLKNGEQEGCNGKVSGAPEAEEEIVNNINGTKDEKEVVVNGTTESVSDFGSVSDANGSVSEANGSVNDANGSVSDATGSVSDATSSVSDATSSVSDATESVSNSTESISGTTESVNGTNEDNNNSSVTYGIDKPVNGGIENCDEIIEECNGLIQACIEDIKKSSDEMLMMNGELSMISGTSDDYEDSLISEDSAEEIRLSCSVIGHTTKNPTEQPSSKLASDILKKAQEFTLKTNGHSINSTEEDEQFNGDLEEHGHMDLHGAIAQKDARLVRQLLKTGEDPDEPDWESGGLPPLLQATLVGDIEIVKALLEAGCTVNVRNSQGETALHLAVGARGFNLQLIEVLLDFNIDPNIQDNVSGQTALHVLLRQISTSRSPRRGRVPLSALLAAFTLLVKRCNVNIPSHRRSTVLHRAASTCPELVEPTKILVDSGADMDFQNDERETALMLALEGGHTRAAEVLVTKGCNLSLNNRYQETALHIAARRNSGYVADLILAIEDCPVNAQDLDGNTPLHLAAGKGYTSIVSSILGHPRIDPDTQNSSGCTPLHVAVESGFTSVVQLLVDHNCDVTLNTLEGLSPLDLAQQEFRSRTHPEILSVIHSALDHSVI